MGERRVEAFELAEPNAWLPAGACDRPTEQAQCHFGGQADEFFGIEDDLDSMFFDMIDDGRTDNFE